MSPDDNPSTRVAPDSAGQRVGQDDDGVHSPAEAFAAAKSHLAEIKEYIGHYVGAKVDGIKVSIRNAGIYAALGIVGLVALSAFVTSAVAIACVGLAFALAALFHSLWAGFLVTGVLLLGLLGATAWLGLKRLTKSSRERTVQKYESRRKEQRTEFGRDASQRAREPAE